LIVPLAFCSHLCAAYAGAQSMGSTIHLELKRGLFSKYLLYGDVSAKAAQMLAQPQVSEFFARLIQRVSPKSYIQALGEVNVTQKFLENFSGDQVQTEGLEFFKICCAVWIICS
ncbi:hypothetical protein BHM03_00022257, partial [Ensete ventricosum]